MNAIKTVFLFNDTIGNTTHTDEKWLTFKFSVGDRVIDVYGNSYKVEKVSYELEGHFIIESIPE